MTQEASRRGPPGLALPRLERGSGISIEQKISHEAEEARQETAALAEDTLYRASPIARKIVVFNLVAQIVLVAGILFLNQFERSLVEQRAQALARDAHIISRAISMGAVGPDGVLNEASAVELASQLGPLSEAGLRLFDADGERLVAVNVFERAEEPQAPASAAAFDLVLERIAALVRGNEVPVTGMSRAEARAFALPALRGDELSRVVRNTDGAFVLMLAIPVMGIDAPAGVVMLSTRAGEIDAAAALERRRLMTIFLLALTVSIGLSVVLARSIARPLRVLALTAEKASRSTRSMAPERITFPDLTGRPDEIGELSRALILMTQALYERIEANEVFAADVAHEIKNPLTSLRSAVETMHYARTDEQRQKLLDVIAKDVQRLDRLVTDISNASRLDSELVREEMEPFDLAALVGSLVDYNQQGAEKVGATLKTVRPSGPVRIKGIEGRLAQVFVNLITNALSFSEEGDTVTAEVRVEGDQAVVEVRDTGPGIPPENLQDVFSRFYSSRPGQEFGNHSGLGLAISKQIVEAHGGTIVADNLDDGQGGRAGARFTVRLPL